MNDPLRLPCPTCSGTRTTTTGDRHAETVMDVCGTCQDTGTIPARPGETPEASYRPAATQPAVPYYAEGGTVRKASIRTPNGDGSCTITLGFPVCHMAPECGDEAAVTVAALMNMGDAAQRATAEHDGLNALERMSTRVKAALIAWHYAQSTATIDEHRADTDFGAMMDAILVSDDVIPGADALPAAPGIYSAVLAFGAAARNAKHDADGEAHVMRHLRVVLDTIAAQRVRAACADGHALGWAGIEADEARIAAWVVDRFGADSLQSAPERADRLLEEAIEIHQAVYAMEGRLHLDARDRAVRLVRHVYDKAPGDPRQEMGGLMTCALALGHRLGARPDLAAQAELARIEALSKDHFDKRHQAKVDAGVAAQHARPDAFQAK